MLNFFQYKLTAPQKPDPCEPYRIQTADLRVQLHQSYDREKLQNYTIAQLQADNQRLSHENANLRFAQQESLLEELADRLLDRKSRKETPSVTLPCPHHQQVHLSFQPTR